jgi:hypothetical protein
MLSRIYTKDTIMFTDTIMLTVPDKILSTVQLHDAKQLSLKTHEVTAYHNSIILYILELVPDPFVLLYCNKICSNQIFYITFSHILTSVRQQFPVQDTHGFFCLALL